MADEDYQAASTGSAVRQRDRAVSATHQIRETDDIPVSIKTGQSTAELR
jgi:hypothetical protein